MVRRPVAKFFDMLRQQGHLDGFWYAMVSRRFLMLKLC
jgi:hypothetical protein